MSKMSKMITEQERMQYSNQPDGAGVPVFGHTQVDEAFRLWANMLPQERRVLAAKMAAHDAVLAYKWALDLLDAISDCAAVAASKWRSNATGSVMNDGERLK